MGPSQQTVKRLCTLSNNRCAFYGCDVALVRDEVDSFAGEIAHIKGARPGSARYDENQTDDERHRIQNLMLLCGTHHKEIDAMPVTKYSTEYLLQMKMTHERFANPESHPIDAKRAERLLRKYEVQINGSVTVESIHATTVNIKSSRKSPAVKIALPSKVIGGSYEHRNYASHLIERYKKMAQWRPSRDYRHAAVYGAIKGRFGAKWDWIPLDRFEEFVSFVQQKIDGTRVGKLNRSKGAPNYSTFEQFRCEHAKA